MKNMNTKHNHTPGTWHTNGTLVYGQINPGGYKINIAEICREASVEAVKANAALIASAPALLAERDAANELLALTQKAAIAVAEERDALRACLTRTRASLPGCVSRGQYYTEAILADIRAALSQPDGK